MYKEGFTKNSVIICSDGRWRPLYITIIILISEEKEEVLEVFCSSRILAQSMLGPRFDFLVKINK